jgi:hypothetical protein
VYNRDPDIDLIVYSDIDSNISVSTVYSYVFDWCSNIARDCVGGGKILSALSTVAEFSILIYEYDI